MPADPWESSGAGSSQGERDPWEPPAKNRGGFWDTVDSYTGAPGRAAAVAAHKAVKENSGSMLIAGAKAFANQFGQDTNLAPSVTQTQRELGIPDVSMDKAFGGGDHPHGPIGLLLEHNRQQGRDVNLGSAAVSVGTDPLTYLPVGEIGSMVGKAGVKITQALGSEKLAGLLRTGAVAAAETHMRPTPQVAEKIGEQGLKQGAEFALDSNSIKPFAKVKGTANELAERAIFPRYWGGGDAAENALAAASSATKKAGTGGLLNSVPDIVGAQTMLYNAINHPTHIPGLVAGAALRAGTKGRMASTVATSLNALSQLKGEQLVKALSSPAVKGLLRGGYTAGSTQDRE